MMPDIDTINKGRGKESVELLLDEYEAIRLIDYMGLTQNECAKQMSVARSTITATYDNARYKISNAIINNKQIKIVDSDIQLCKNSGYCCGQCGKNKCVRCNHGNCEYCIGIIHEAGKQCIYK